MYQGGTRGARDLLERRLDKARDHAPQPRIKQAWIKQIAALGGDHQRCEALKSLYTRQRLSDLVRLGDRQRR